jgi:MerR family transcriptional regulator/heat shock protein HspR
VTGSGTRWFDQALALSERPVYVISVAAELSGLHPQTLRGYDRLGLVIPGRSPGGGRRYSERDVALLREVSRLSAQGVSLPGIQRILELEREVAALQVALAGLDRALQASRAEAADAVRQARNGQRRDLVPIRRDAASVVLWRRHAARPRRPA